MRIPTRRDVTRLLVVLSAWGLSCAPTGCTGHASVHMIPRGMKKISTTESLVVRIKPRECYFWINDDQKLCVAMRDASRIPLGRLFAREALLSFVLGNPPASAARNYRVDRRTLRVRIKAGLAHVRSASLSGIFAVWDYERTRLRGRFRVTVKQQSYSALTGWAANRRVLLVGEFTAVRNRKAGERILARTEANGMSRAALKATSTSVHDSPRGPDKGTTGPRPRLTRH